MIPKVSPWKPTKEVARDMVFAHLDVVVQDLMRWPDMTAYEKMVDLCYQEHPTSLKDFVHISMVNKCSINPICQGY